MKKLVSTVLVLFLLQTVQAQVVRVGALGFGVGGGSSNAGLTLHILEASYAPQPRFDVGLYTNLGLGVSTDETSESGSVKGGFGVGAQGKFYLLTGKVKPFVGLQAGPKFGGTASVSATGETAEGDAGVSMSVVPQLGLRFGPLNIWGSYTNSVVQGNVGLVFGFGKFDK